MKGSSLSVVCIVTMIVALVLSQFSGVGLFSWCWICH